MRPSTDALVAVLHAVATAALALSLVTGMRIAADAPDAAWSTWLAALAPMQHVHGWHLLGGFTVCGIAVGYWAYLRLTGSEKRFTLRREAAGGNARAQLRRLNIRLWLVLFVLLGVLGITGALILLDTDLGSGVSLALVVEAHRGAAWALLGGVACHVAAQYAFGSAVATAGWARAAAGADWLMKIVRPRLTPAMTATAAERNLRTLLGFGAWRRSQLRMYLTGCLCFALGIKCFIDADLGVDPLHAMTIGIVQAVDTPYLRIGFVDSALTALFLCIWMAWNRRWPPLTVFVTMALVGYLVDIFNLFGAERLTEPVLAPAFLMLAGLLLEAYGSALIIMSAVGIRAMDLVAITMVRRLGWRFYAAKLSMEAGFLLIGWLLAGPLGLATVAFLVVVPLAIEPFIWVNGRYFRLANLGLPTRLTLPDGRSMGGRTWRHG